MPSVVSLDLSKFSFRRIAWVILAIIFGLIGLVAIFGHTGPKMMSAGEDGGATPGELLASFGPIIAALVALVKGIISKDPSEVVNAIKALASNPKSLELIHRAETAILDRLRLNHAENPTVMAKISELAVEIAKTNHPPGDVQQASESQTRPLNVTGAGSTALA